ncbi:hypothetical protein [Sporolactobacillus vineae]|uniref:hypothetical protein n=1 Tax=Sporolactobacillus vineae TaxID=444463 RepID=UPI000289E31C|nr:hypothetical protein [Sporolactobacillus vineae]
MSFFILTLNASAVCDLGEFIRNIEELSWSQKPAEACSKMFLNFLEDYHPGILDAYHGSWIEKLDNGIKNRLSQTLGQILLDLKKSGDRREMRRLLTNGASVEPYKGFCRSWLDVLDHANTASLPKKRLAASVTNWLHGSGSRMTWFFRTGADPYRLFSNCRRRIGTDTCVVFLWL